MPTLLDLIREDKELQEIPGKIKETAKEVGSGILKGAIDTLGMGGDIVNAGRKLTGAGELPIGSKKLRQETGIGEGDSPVESIASFFQPGVGGKALAGAGIIASKDFIKKFPEFEKSLLKKGEELVPLFHGTSKDEPFKTFKANRRGNFLGESPKVASDYALDNESMDLVYEGGKYVKKNTASRVMPVYVNITNPYRLTDEEAALYMRTENYAKAQRNLMDKAKAQGYDAIQYPDGSWAIADPKQIKSALTFK